MLSYNKRQTLNMYTIYIVHIIFPRYFYNNIRIMINAEAFQLVEIKQAVGLRPYNETGCCLFALSVEILFFICKHFIISFFSSFRCID
jgi:hypothetical protein